MNKKYLIEFKSLMHEWDFEKNNQLGLDPNFLTHGCNKKAWWKCAKCDFSWQSKIANRTILQRGCPCCANLIVVKGINDLATTNPNWVKEWYPYKNTDITPNDVVAGSKRKIWWLCPKGHAYQSSLLHKKHGTNCPVCYSSRQTSFAEQCVYYYIKKLYPDAISRYKAEWLEKMELDIFIPSINYAIEYDGLAWHKKDKINNEQKKYKICQNHNIKLIRFRENFADLGSDIADYQYGCKDLYKSKILEHVVINVLTFLNFKGYGCPISINIERDRNEILQYMNDLNKNSFADKFPNLAKEWHHEKNGLLNPYMFKPYSDFKVWWICSKCGYEFEASFGHRSYGTGCKKCSVQNLLLTNSKPVKMIDKKTNKSIKIFKSISDAAREMNINDSNISMVCNGKRLSAGGYIWRYYEDNDKSSF